MLLHPSPIHALRKTWQSTVNRYLSTAKTPVQEYNRLVKLGQLTRDEFQYKVLQNLTVFHSQLSNYTPPKVPVPTIDEIIQYEDQLSVKNPVLKFYNSVFKNTLHPTIEFLNKYNREANTFDLSHDYKNIPKGLYLWGDVGCGKTMLMDLFYSTIPPHLTKKRIHFHQFIQSLHKKSHEIIKKAGPSSEIDPIPILAAELVNSSNVLCFDEFQVTDVADAMLLRRLLLLVLNPKYGLVLFTTSNREPMDLYINGIQRESFIPVINLLQDRTNVVNLNSNTDYRRIPRPESLIYYYPSNTAKTFNIDYFDPKIKKKRENHTETWFQYYAQLELPNDPNVTSSKLENLVKYNDTLKVWGREIRIPKSIPSAIAQFTFKELCGQPLAAGDYLLLAKTYRAFIITDIPYLSINLRDEIRRFITFLDAAYDNHCKLATTNANTFSKLFVDNDLVSNYTPFNLKPGVKDSDLIDYNNIKGGSSITNVGSTTRNDSHHHHELETPQVHALETVADMFALDEEKFAFVRALSRLNEISSTAWVNYKLE